MEVSPLPSLTPPFFFFCCSSSARWSHFGAAAGWRFRLSRLRLRNGGVCLRVCSPHFSPPPQTPSPPLSRKFWRRRHQISEQPKFKWAVTEAMTMYHKERNIWMELSLLDLSPDHCSPLMPFFLHLHFHFPVFRFSIGKTPKLCILLSHLCQPRTDPDLNDDLLRQFSIVLQSFFLAPKHQSLSRGRGIFTGGGAFLALYFGGHMRWHCLLPLSPARSSSSSPLICSLPVIPRPLPYARPLYHRHGSGLTLARARWRTDEVVAAKAESESRLQPRNRGAALLPTNERPRIRGR